MYSPIDDENETVILPSEIWEKVLLLLFNRSPQSFLRAAKVCVQWRHLAIRICKKLYLSKLSASTIDELYETQATHRKYSEKYKTENGDLCGEEWLNIFALHQETRLTSPNQILSMGNFENESIYVEDPFLLLATHHSSEGIALKKTSVTIYNALESISEEDVGGFYRPPLNDSNVYSSFEIQQEIYDVHFLFLSSPVLLIRTREFDWFLQWVVVPKGRRSNKPIHGIINSESVKGEHISIESKYLLSIDDLSEGKHTLYEASLDDNRSELQLDWICTFKIGIPIFASKLLRGHIKINSCNGFIRMYSLQKYLKKQHSKQQSPSSKSDCDSSPDSSSSVHNSFQLAASSNFLKDLRYPNRSFFSQYWTFTSTTISSQLLYYWHMDRGREFSWIVGSTFELTGDPNKNEISSAPKHNIMLRNIIIGEEITAEVTALQFTRGVLLCGTSKGHILLYKLQEEAESKKNNNLDFLKRAPWISASMIEREIKAISGLWTSSGLIVTVLDVDKHSAISIIPFTE